MVENTAVPSSEQEFLRSRARAFFRDFGYSSPASQDLDRSHLEFVKPLPVADETTFPRFHALFRLAGKLENSRFKMHIDNQEHERASYIYDNRVISECISLAHKLGNQQGEIAEALTQSIRKYVALELKKSRKKARGMHNHLGGKRGKKNIAFERKQAELRTQVDEDDNEEDLS